MIVTVDQNSRLRVRGESFDAIGTSRSRVLLESSSILCEHAILSAHDLRIVISKGFTKLLLVVYNPLKEKDKIKYKHPLSILRIYPLKTEIPLNLNNIATIYFLFLIPF